MNRVKIVFVSSILLFFIISGCVKNDLPTFNGAVAEMDATTWIANAAGVDYPILSQNPGFGRTVATENTACNAGFVDPFITRTSGTVRLRVNLVGPTSSTDREVGFRVINVPATSVTFRKKTPTCANYTLALSNAVQGTHFNIASMKATVPADSSFAYITVNILDAGATAGAARVLGLELDSTGSVLPNLNYRRVAIAIDQR